MPLHFEEQFYLLLQEQTNSDYFSFKCVIILDFTYSFNLYIYFNNLILNCIEFLLILLKFSLLFHFLIE